MTLLEIKDTYAKSVGYEDWEDLYESHFWDGKEIDLNNHFDQVMKIYAMECLKKASENAYIDYGIVTIDKSSIHNKNNLV